MKNTISNALNKKPAPSLFSFLVPFTFFNAYSHQPNTQEILKEANNSLHKGAQELHASQMNISASNLVLQQAKSEYETSLRY